MIGCSNRMLLVLCLDCSNALLVGVLCQIRCNCTHSGHCHVSIIGLWQVMMMMFIVGCWPSLMTCASCRVSAPQALDVVDGP